MDSIRLSELTDEQNFDEAAYLAANPDVAAAVAAGHLSSGKQHYDLYGKREGRPVRFRRGLDDLRAGKMERLQPFLRLDLPHVSRGLKLDFLTEAIRAETRIIDTEAVSGHPYDPAITELIHEQPAGLCLDCGAGRRPIYYSNVINYEIVDYDTTDVVGVGEYLPFQDNVFDAVFSVAVLEHVRDPFKCAAEISRVLKPGGKLLCCVPFLQPLHGYPHHYYNMTVQGLRALFEDHLDVDRQTVPGSCLPVWWLTWALASWANGLTGRTREEFELLRISDVMGSPQDSLSRPWVQELSDDKNFELAAATMIFAHKR